MSDVVQPSNIARPDELIADLSPNSNELSDGRVCILQEREHDLAKFARQLHENLVLHRLVFHPWTGTSHVQVELLKPDSGIKQAVASGFYRIVILDLTCGMNSDHRFDLPLFYQYCFHQLSDAFDLPKSQPYHEEDVTQILKDEPTSLICLLNAHHAPSRERKRLRCLTQEAHSAFVSFEVVSPKPTRHGRRPYLIVIGSSSRTNTQSDITPQFLSVTTPYCLLGRESPSDIVIAEPVVSRRHALIVASDGQYTIEDVGSSNGTALNGNDVTARVAITDGDKISLAGYCLEFRLSEEKADVTDDFDDYGTDLSGVQDTSYSIPVPSFAIVDALNDIAEENEMWRILLEWFFDSYSQIDHGTVWRRDVNDYLHCVCDKNRGDGRCTIGPLIPEATEIINDVGIALRFDDVSTDSRLAAMRSGYRSREESVARLPRCSVICVIIGSAANSNQRVLELVSYDPERRFEDEHENVVSVIASYLSTFRAWE